MDIAKLKEELSGKDTIYCCILANEYLSSNESDKCMEILETVKEKHPQYSPAYLLMAKCYNKKGQLRPAYDALKQCLTLERNNLYAMNLYAEVCGLLGKHENELATYEELLKFYGSDIVIEQKISEIKKKLGSLELDEEIKPEEPVANYSQVDGGVEINLDTLEPSNQVTKNQKSKNSAEEFLDSVSLELEVVDDKTMVDIDNYQHDAGYKEEKILIKSNQEGVSSKEVVDDFSMLQELFSKELSDGWDVDSEKQADEDLLKGLPEIKLLGEESGQDLQEDEKIVFENTKYQEESTSVESEQVKVNKIFLEDDVSVEGDEIIKKVDFFESEIELQNDLESNDNLEIDALAEFQYDKAENDNDGANVVKFDGSEVEQFSGLSSLEMDIEGDKKSVTEAKKDLLGKDNVEVKVEFAPQNAKTMDFSAVSDLGHEDYTALKEKIKRELKEELKREILAEIANELNKKNIPEISDVTALMQDVEFGVEQKEDFAAVGELTSEKGHVDEPAEDYNMDLELLLKDRNEFTIQPVAQSDTKADEQKVFDDLDNIQFSLDEKPFDGDLTIEENKVLFDGEDNGENVVEDLVEERAGNFDHSHSEMEEEFDFSITDSDLEKFGLKRAEKKVSDDSFMPDAEVEQEYFKALKDETKSENSVKDGLDDFIAKDDDEDIDIESLLNDFRIDTKKGEDINKNVAVKSLEKQEAVTEKPVELEKFNTANLDFSEELEIEGSTNILPENIEDIADEIEKNESRLTFDDLRGVGYIDIEDNITDSVRNIKIDESNLETSEIEHFDSLSQVTSLPETIDMDEELVASVGEEDLEQISTDVDISDKFAKTTNDEKYAKFEIPSSEKRVNGGATEILDTQKSEEPNSKEEHNLLENLVEDNFIFEIPEEIENLDKYDADYDAGCAVGDVKNQKMVERLQSIINSKGKNENGVDEDSQEEEDETSYAFITPTLAELYEAQGFFDKAIYMYKKLDKAEQGKYKEKIKELTQKMGQ